MAYDIDALLRAWSEPPDDDAAAAAVFRRLYTDPVTLNGTPVPAAQLVARARALGAMLEGATREVIDVVEDGDRVAVAFRLTGRHVGPYATRLGDVAATGRTLALRVIDVLTLVDGRIARVEMVADELGALHGLGAVALVAPGAAPAPGAPAPPPPAAAAPAVAAPAVAAPAPVPPPAVDA